MCLLLRQMHQIKEKEDEFRDEVSLRKKGHNVIKMTNVKIETKTRVCQLKRGWRTALILEVTSKLYN